MTSKNYLKLFILETPGTWIRLFSAFTLGVSGRKCSVVSKCFFSLSSSFPVCYVLNSEPLLSLGHVAASIGTLDPGSLSLCYFPVSFS